VLAAAVAAVVCRWMPRMHRGWGTLTLAARFTRKHAGIDATSVDNSSRRCVSGEINAASATVEFGATARFVSRLSKCLPRSMVATIL
jgi:hypothetical protein